MSSTALNIIQGTTRQVPLSVVKDDGTPVPLNAPGTRVVLRVWDSASDVGIAPPIFEKTSDDPAQIAIQSDGTALILFVPDDTNVLQVKAYAYLVQMTSPDAGTVDVIPVSVFNVTLGGITATPLPPFSNTVKVDHNYGLPDALRYMTPDGSPIAEAQVRLYYKSDYTAGLLDTPIGSTLTDAFGRWKNPILVTPGYTLIAYFLKPNEFGPDTTEIAV